MIVVSSLRIGGGAERNAVHLGNTLRDMAHHVTFLTFYRGGVNYDWDGEHICFDYKEHQNIFKDMLEIVVTARKIRSICREKNIDVIISFLTRMNVQSLLSKALFRNRTKILVSVRNHPLKRNKRWHQMLMKWLYPKAHRVVAQTEGIEKLLRENFHLKNTVVIPNMADPEVFEDSADGNILDEHNMVFEDGSVFITIGSLTEQKAQWHMLRSFKRLADEHEFPRLVIIGKGPLSGRLEKMVEDMDIRNRVHFLGEVKNVFPYLKRADCFILTSLFEGFPNVLVEALSQDMVIISTDCVSGPRELLCPDLKVDEKVTYPHFGKYGILIQPLEGKGFFKTLEEKPLTIGEEVLLDAIETVINDRRITSRYDSVSERVDDFDRKKIVKKWEDLL